METAAGLGAAALATGHYVRSKPGAIGWELYRAANKERDQSYFLFATTKAQLEYLRFPLGGLPKAETRALARRFALPVADKPDSQDICFVPQGGYAAIVEKLHPGAARPGDIVDAGGAVLGRHQGIIHYTIGQRRGLGIAAGEPLYVVRLEAEECRVVVGPKQALARDRLTVTQVNWLGTGALPQQGVEARVKIRSAGKQTAAMLRPLPGGRAEVAFAEPQFGVAPGQACVFYAGTRVLGGGWIARQQAAPGKAAFHTEDKIPTLA